MWGTNTGSSNNKKSIWHVVNMKQDESDADWSPAEYWEQPHRGGYLVFTDMKSKLVSVRLDLAASLAPHFFPGLFQGATVASATLIRRAGMEFLIFARRGCWGTLWSPKHFSVSTPQTSSYWLRAATASELMDAGCRRQLFLVSNIRPPLTPQLAAKSTATRWQVRPSWPGM